MGGACFVITVNMEGARQQPMARGEHTGNDVCAVGVTHDLSMLQMSCPDVSPAPLPPSLSHSHSLTYVSAFRVH